MSAIGDVHPPEVKAPERTTTLASLNDEAAKRPAITPVAMEAPDATLMNRPNTSALPLPAEAAQPMSPDNGHAVARAMHALITVNVQTTQALVLTELKAPATQDAKQQDYRREHRSNGKRDPSAAIGEDDAEGGQGSKKRSWDAPSDPEEAEAADMIALLELLKRAEPLQPETVARVNRFLETGAAALVTTAPTRFRVPFRI